MMVMVSCGEGGVRGEMEELIREVEKIRE